MRKFTIDEISAVDRPAQGGARALLMKAASEDEDGDDDGYRLVAKAADLVARSEAIEDLLDGAAEERSSETGETFERAYAKVLFTDAGREAYRRICELREEAVRC